MPCGLLAPTERCAVRQRDLIPTFVSMPCGLLVPMERSGSRVHRLALRGRFYALRAFSSYGTAEAAAVAGPDHLSFYALRAFSSYGTEVDLAQAVAESDVSMALRAFSSYGTLPPGRGW